MWLEFARKEDDNEYLLPPPYNILQLPFIIYNRLSRCNKVCVYVLKHHCLTWIDHYLDRLHYSGVGMQLLH